MGFLFSNKKHMGTGDDSSQTFFRGKNFAPDEDTIMQI
jgi:hypothetical protein